jgi:glycosyltransferase involved in cell wall biosynthesis
VVSGAEKGVGLDSDAIRGRTASDMLITIGIPFREDVATLPLALRSVFAQSRGDWELILVDDGSSDGALELVRRVRDNRVRVLSDGRNLGLPARLNQITREARGEIIVRMDADDAMHPERLEEQARVLDDPNVDVVASPAYAMTSERRVYGIKGQDPITDDPSLFFRSGVIIHPTMAARRSWMLAHPYDISYLRTQDKELFCRTHPSSRFVKLTEPLLFYTDSRSFSPAFYHQSRRNDRRILLSHGWARLGTAAVLRGVGVTYLKEVALSGLRLVGKTDRYILSRADAASEAVLASAHDVLDAISRTPIPGLDEPAIGTRTVGLGKDKEQAMSRAARLQDAEESACK